MNEEVLLQFVRSVREGNASEIFPIVKEAFGLRAAAEAVSMVLSDEKTYRYLCDALGDDFEAERVLLSFWDADRFSKVRSGSPEFFLYISLVPYLTGQEDAHHYRIGTSVRLSQGKPIIWFHHIISHERMKDPADCVTWDKFSSEEHALWSLLVSKILSLPETWYIDAVKTSNDALLVPYDLSTYE